jgi:hypothetical protein
MALSGYNPILSRETFVLTCLYFIPIPCLTFLFLLAQGLVPLYLTSYFPTSQHTHTHTNTHTQMQTSLWEPKNY